MFRSIKTERIYIFHKWYLVVASIIAAIATDVVVVTASPREKDMPYREFNIVKSPEIESVRDPVIAMRWIFDVEGCFYTCSCRSDLKFSYTQNLLCHGVKPWCNFVTKDYSPVEKNAITWEQFVEND